MASKSVEKQQLQGILDFALKTKSELREKMSRDLYPHRCLAQASYEVYCRIESEARKLAKELGVELAEGELRQD